MSALSLLWAVWEKVELAYFPKYWTGLLFIFGINEETSADQFKGFEWEIGSFDGRRLDRKDRFSVQTAQNPLPTFKARRKTLCRTCKTQCLDLAKSPDKRKKLRKIWSLTWIRLFCFFSILYFRGSPNSLFVPRWVIGFQKGSRQLVMLDHKTQQMKSGSDFLFLPHQQTKVQPSPDISQTPAQTTHQPIFEAQCG